MPMMSQDELRGRLDAIEFGALPVAKGGAFEVAFVKEIQGGSYETFATRCDALGAIGRHGALIEGEPYAGERYSQLIPAYLPWRGEWVMAGFRSVSGSSAVAHTG